MSSDEVISEKKRAMLAYKQKLLNDLAICDKRIEEVRRNRSHVYYEEDDESSDSDTGLPVQVPSAVQLKLQSAQLGICLQATQELTSLQVIDSEVNVMVDPPKLKNNDTQFPEDGLWREVTAECRFDLVPFSINFYVYKPAVKFGSLCYEELQVTAVKAAHERELSRSVLAAAVRPSDAIQVIRSYAAAHRSRRTTLSTLADKFPDSLFMQAKEDGGYMLKCADLLEISWTLQNKWSPIAPFYHRLKFDLEYMDDSYIKTIKNAHRQLMDPAVETDERTFLLARIIDTCLAANQASLSSIHDSDTEPAIAQKPPSRRTTLDQEPEMPVIREKPPKKTNKDTEVMAPPKQLPKKSKSSKGKENVVKSNIIKEKQPDKEIKQVGDGKVSEKQNVVKDDSNRNKRKAETNDGVSKKSKTDTGTKKTKSNDDHVESKKNDNKEVNSVNKVVLKEKQKSDPNMKSDKNKEGSHNKVTHSQKDSAKSTKQSNSNPAKSKTATTSQETIKEKNLNEKPVTKEAKQGTKHSKDVAEDINKEQKKTVAKIKEIKKTAAVNPKQSEKPPKETVPKVIDKIVSGNKPLEPKEKHATDPSKTTKVKTNLLKTDDVKVKTSKDTNKNILKTDDKGKQQSVKVADKKKNEERTEKLPQTDNRTQNPPKKVDKSKNPLKNENENAVPLKKVDKNRIPSKEMEVNRNTHKVDPAKITKIPVLKSKVPLKQSSAPLARVPHGNIKKIVNPSKIGLTKKPTINALTSQQIVMGIRNSPRLIKKPAPKSIFGN